jgi:AcrR family transcriptional regulator
MPPQATPTEVVRGRVMAGLVAAVAERGYGAVTINDIVRTAQVSKSTFYAQFADKEDCFLAAYEIAAEVLLEAIVAAASQDLPDEERILAGAQAYLDTIAADPVTARTFILEVLAAGPAALAKRHAVNARFADVLRALSEERGLSGGRALTPVAAQLIVGGTYELVLAALVEDRLAELPAQAPAVAELVLAAVEAPPVRR